jgi:hypothetical protein
MLRKMPTRNRLARETKQGVTLLILVGTLASSYTGDIKYPGDIFSPKEGTKPTSNKKCPLGI